MGLRLTYSRCKSICFIIVGTLCFLSFCMYYIKPVRNFLLKPVLPNPWRFVDTADILRMRQVEYPPNVTDPVACPKMVKPRVKLEDVDQKSIIKYKNANSDNPFFHDEKYSHFLPAITWQERVDSIYLYMVLAETLNKIGVNFFFTGGSLLGVVRHEGAIPWDTDVDLAVNATSWMAVRDQLSCLEGFQLRTKWHMHWKFNFEGKFFPFVDIFFYLENERYVYAMNYYTLHSILYEKMDVLPLRMAPYEGILVPVPNEYERCTRVEFDLEYCYPPNKNHKTGHRFKKTVVKCSSMSDYYPVRNVKF